MVRRLSSRVVRAFLRGDCRRAIKGCPSSYDTRAIQRVVNAVYAGAATAEPPPIQPAAPPAAPASVAAAFGEGNQAGGGAAAPVATLVPKLTKRAGGLLTWTRPIAIVIQVGGIWVRTPQIAACAAVQRPANGILCLADLPAEEWRSRVMITTTCASLHL